MSNCSHPRHRLLDFTLGAASVNSGAKASGILLAFNFLADGCCFLLPGLQIIVHFIRMLEVVGDNSVDIPQGERWEAVPDLLGRRSFPKGGYNGNRPATSSSTHVATSYRISLITDGITSARNMPSSGSTTAKTKIQLASCFKSNPLIN